MCSKKSSYLLKLLLFLRAYAVAKSLGAIHIRQKASKTTLEITSYTMVRNHTLFTRVEGEIMLPI